MRHNLHSMLWHTSVIFRKSSFGRSSSNIDRRCFFHEALDRSRRLRTRTVGWDRQRTGGMPWELNGELGGVWVLTSEIIGIDPLDAVDAPDRHPPTDVVAPSSERRSWSGNWYEKAVVSAVGIPSMSAQLRDPCELSKKPLDAEAGRGDGDSDGVDRSLAIEYRARPGDNCGRCCCCCCWDEVTHEVSTRWWRGFWVDLGPTGRQTLVHRSAGRHSVPQASDDIPAISWSVPGAAGRLCRWRFFGGRSELVSVGHDCRQKTQQTRWQWSCPSSPGRSPLDRRRDVSHPAAKPLSWHIATNSVSSNTHLHIAMMHPQQLPQMLHIIMSHTQTQQIQAQPC